MPCIDLPQLLVVPGECVVLFLVQLDQAASMLAVRSTRFLEGLKASRDLLGFAGVQREEADLAELLPWTGSV